MDAHKKNGGGDHKANGSAHGKKANGSSPGNHNGNAQKANGADHGQNANKANGADHGQHGNKANGADHGQQANKPNGADHGKQADKANGADNSHNAKGSDNGKQADKNDGSNKSQDAKGKDGNKQSDKGGDSNKSQDAKGKDGNKQSDKNNGSDKSENGKGDGSQKSDGSSNVANVQFDRTQRSARNGGSADGGAPSKPPISDDKERKIERKGQTNFHDAAQNQPDGSAVKEFDNLQHLQVANNDPDSPVYQKYDNKKINKRLHKLVTNPNTEHQIEKAQNQAITAATKDVTGKTPGQLAGEQKKWLESDKVQKHRDNLSWDKRQDFTHKNLNKIMDFSIKQGSQAKKDLAVHDYSLPNKQKFKLAGPKATYDALHTSLQNTETFTRIVTGDVGSGAATAGRGNRAVKAVREWKKLTDPQQRQTEHAISRYLTGDHSALRGLGTKGHDVAEVITQAIDGAADITAGGLATWSLLTRQRQSTDPNTGSRTALADGAVILGTLATGQNSLEKSYKGLKQLLGATGGNANTDVSNSRTQKLLNKVGYATDVGNLIYAAGDAQRAHHLYGQGDNRRGHYNAGLATVYTVRGLLGAALRPGAVGWAGQAAGRKIGAAIGQASGNAANNPALAHTAEQTLGYAGGQIGYHVAESVAQAARTATSSVAAWLYHADAAEGQKQQKWSQNSLLKMGTNTTPGTNYLNSGGKQQLKDLNQEHKSDIQTINQKGADNLIQAAQKAPKGSDVRKYVNLLHAKQTAREGNSPESNLINLDKINREIDKMRNDPGTWGEIEKARNKAYNSAFTDVTHIQGHDNTIKATSYAAWQRDAFGPNVSLDAGRHDTPVSLDNYNIPKNQSNSWGVNNRQHKRSSPMAAQLATNDYNRYYGDDGNPLPDYKRYDAQVAQLKNLQFGDPNAAPTQDHWQPGGVFNNGSPNDGYLTPDGRDALNYLLNAGPLYDIPDPLPFGYDPSNSSQNVGNWYNPPGDRNQGFVLPSTWGANNH